MEALEELRLCLLNSFETESKAMLTEDELVKGARGKRRVYGKPSKREVVDGATRQH